MKDPLLPASRDRLVSAAAELLQLHGYRGVGLNEVSDLARVPKGSMYHHFPRGKQELTAAAIDRSGTVVAQMLEQFLRPPTRVVHAVASFVDILANQLEQSDFTLGCPIATTALEIAAESAQVAAAADAAFDSWTAILERRLAEEGWAEPSATATTIISAIEGALVLARARRSAVPLYEVQLVVERLLAPPTPF